MSWILWVVIAIVAFFLFVGWSLLRAASWADDWSEKQLARERWAKEKRRRRSR